MKILLVCSAGMSTSLLVERMLAAAKERQLDVDIEARPIADTVRYGQDADAIMLGPQVRFQLSHIKSRFPEKPVEVIDMRDYGTMNGKNVFQNAMEMIEQNKSDEMG